MAKAQQQRAGEFAADGLRLRYPENWALEREEAGNGWTVLIQSPGAAFLTVTLDRDDPTPQHMAATALAALTDDYPALEADEVVESVAGRPAVGHDVRFFKFDLLNGCWTRAFAAGGGTVLVLGQATEHEGDTPARVLKAICASIAVED